MLCKLQNALRQLAKIVTSRVGNCQFLSLLRGARHVNARNIGKLPLSLVVGVDYDGLRVMERFLLRVFPRIFRMRAAMQTNRRGFTLVELMIVVAIIGILASLAVFGVNRYLKSAKSSEARNGLGRIVRAAEESFARETVVSELVSLGTESATIYHQLCDSALPVPASVPAGRKYVPSNTSGSDFARGTATAGWKCLQFEVHDPIYYQYNYLRDSTALCALYSCTGASQTPNFEAATIGDLDADGSYSAFILNGEIDGTAKQLNRATQIHVYDEFE